MEAQPEAENTLDNTPEILERSMGTLLAQAAVAGAATGAGAVVTQQAISGAAKLKEKLKK